MRLRRDRTTTTATVQSRSGTGCSAEVLSLARCHSHYSPHTGALCLSVLSLTVFVSATLYAGSEGSRTHWIWYVCCSYRQEGHQC